jgi:NAD(P) transhydrogenase subunit alpha
MRRCLAGSKTLLHLTSFISTCFPTLEHEEVSAVNPDVLLGAYVFVLAIFLGVVLISRVPSTLHTPLMSATNAIHGIVMIGAIIVLGSVDSWWLETIAFVAVVLGAANAVGGFTVTDRMLEMFKPRTQGGRSTAAAEQQR